MVTWKTCCAHLMQFRLFTNSCASHAPRRRTTWPQQPALNSATNTTGRKSRHFATLTIGNDLVKSCRIANQELARSLKRNKSTNTKGKRKGYGGQIKLSDIMADTDRILDVDGFELLPWSVSGLETCVVVRKEDMSVAFDMGYPFRQAVKCQHVLISHGHIDHVCGIVSHVCKRGLYNMKPAHYYVPGHLVAPLTKAHQAFGEAHGNINDIPPFNLKSVGPDGIIKLGGNWHARPFPTVHRVASQGYILYRSVRKLKPEFVGLPGAEIGALIRQGEDVHDVITTPELAYTGDTTFELFENPPLEDLLKVKVLITEATYIDNDVDRQGHLSKHKARERGHCHLIEFVENAELFANVGNIVFIHFSDKYPTHYIHKMVGELVPADMRAKVHLGIQLKERNEQDSGS